jgi:hypothetical protein
MTATAFANDSASLFPETQMRSLEDINAQFGETVAVRYFDATAEDEKEYERAIEVEMVENVAVHAKRGEIEQA